MKLHTRRMIWALGLLRRARLLGLTGWGVQADGRSFRPGTEPATPFGSIALTLNRAWRALTTRFTAPPANAALLAGTIKLITLLLALAIYIPYRHAAPATAANPSKPLSAPVACPTIVVGTKRPVAALTLINGGVNYATPPMVTFSGGGGAGATATDAVSFAVVASVTVTANGAGYTTSPTVTFTGGGGTGAAGTAVLQPTSVAAIALTTSGSGYTNVPTVTISGGGGAGATAVAGLNPTTVASITVTNGGSGYSSMPTVMIIGGGGAGATAMANVSGGTVTSITVITNGAGYTSPPTVTISGGGGAGATAVANLTPTSVGSLTLTSVGAGYTSIPSLTITGGGGTGATGIVTALAPTGIAAVTVTNGGSGYITSPAVGFVGGGGAGAAAVANLGGIPVVASVTVTANGAGYTTSPTVTFTGGGGTGAAGTAVLQPTGVATIGVTNGGSGYTSIPTVTITGGGGAGATAIANVSGGAVTSITVLTNGAGYTSLPTVTISGGGGTGATAIVTALLPTGVASVTVISGGSGYTSLPAVGFVGGGGAGAAAVANYGGGIVTSLTLTNGGSGYVTAPTVAFVGGGGSGATATATLAPDVIPSGVAGVVYPSQFFGAIGGASPFSFTASGLPMGLNLDTSTGTLSGIPQQPGSFPIVITATDSNSCQGTHAYTLVIASAPPPGLMVSIQDPAICTGPGGIVSVTATVTNPNPTAQTATFTATLPTQLLAITGTCAANVASTFNCGGTTVSWTGLLNTGQTVTITYQAQVADGTTQGTPLCINSTATIVGSTTTAQACTTVNCPVVGPGSLFPSTGEVSDQKAGSVLVYNLYSSSSSAPNAQNTRVAITNTNPALPIAVHLFFVDGATCSIADSLVCLTPNQTANFLASDIDPGTTGYIIAVASDTVTGCPINFNFLIGDEYVKLSSGHAANLTAESFAALAGSLPACNALSVTTVLSFDGTSYNRAPRVVAASNIPSRADGNDTLIVLNRLGGSLAAGAATLGNLFGILYDDAENPLSFTFTAGVCQFRASLSSSFPRTAPRFEQFIPAGRSGWAKFYSLADVGVLGAQINFNANAGSAANAFNQGHNLHKLTLTSAATLTIPIFPPNC